MLLPTPQTQAAARHQESRVPGFDASAKVGRMSLNAAQILFSAVGLAFVALGLWGRAKLPRLRAAHAAEVSRRVQIDAEIVGYEHQTDDTDEYQAQIEYTVDGHRYRIKAAECVPKPGPLGEKVRIAYLRATPSDAIEVAFNTGWDQTLATASMVLGGLFIAAGFAAQSG